MFDANMRHLPKGKVFFAKVHYCANTSLYNIGVKDGDILKCEMLSQSSINPKVKFYIDNDTFEMTHETDFYDCLITYEGNIDGTGFIDDISKDKAISVLTTQHIRSEA